MLTFNATEIDSLYSASSPLSICLAVLYAAIVFFGLPGNALTIAVVWRKKSMQTPTNLLLANIALADVLSVLLCPVPFAVSVSGRHPSGQLGKYLCMFLTGHATTAVTVCVTYLTLVLLAVERYHGIVKPFKRNLRLSKRKVVFAISLLWLLSIGIFADAFSRSHYDETSGRCIDPWTIEGRLLCTRLRFAGLLAIPVISFSLVFYCHFKMIKSVYFDYKTSRVFNRADLAAKRKIVKVLLTVAIAFHVCYAPFLLLETVISLVDANYLFHEYEKFYIAYRVVSIFLYLNSCLNPFFYGLQCSAFRQNVMSIISSCLKIKKGK